MAAAARGSGQRVLLLGATGSSGRATAQALAEAGHSVTALVRPGADRSGLPGTATIVEGQATDPADPALDTALSGQTAVVSCLASRSGSARDAWAVDHAAHLHVLDRALAASVGRFVLLSAICVQKPRLAFQHAKLAFEAALQESGLSHAIVRPTAYFKSISGQVDRVAAGKPYLVFGDGRLTACKPISDRDLGRFLADCVIDPELSGILPIGGPGPALTPLDIGEMLAELTGQPLAVRRVPPGLLRAIAGGLALAGGISARARDKAEFARIGHYYATESMLLWDPERGRYDAEATPEYGADRLRDHLAARLSGRVADDRGAHAVF